ncbi:MAG: SIMPL domain-containing protein [Pyrinomonadaceae bacterium]
MKSLFCSLALLLCLSAATFAQTDIDKMPLITVTGNAEVMVAPDEVVFNIDVTKLDKDLQVAKRQNDETVAKLLELARRFNVEPRNVKTDYISVEMKYESIRDPKKRVFDEDGDEIGTRVFKGYEVSKTVIVRLTDISRFEEFFAEALKTGITEVSSVKFETSKLRENKDKARDLAMKAAREKARAMASAVDQTIGRAVRVTESTAGNQNYSLNANITANTVSSGVMSQSQSVATFAPGAIKVEATVTVSFLLN